MTPDATIAVLIALLLLPSLQAAREAARRAHGSRSQGEVISSDSY